MQISELTALGVPHAWCRWAHPPSWSADHQDGLSCPHITVVTGKHKGKREKRKEAPSSAARLVCLIIMTCSCLLLIIMEYLCLVNLVVAGKHKDKREKRKERAQQRSKAPAAEEGSQQIHRAPTAAELAAVNAHRKDRSTSAGVCCDLVSDCQTAVHTK